MQLNVYVPKDKAHVVRALDEATRRTGRPKNELVLEAIEAFLAQVRPRIKTYDLGEVKMPSRAELYDEHLDR